MGKAYKNLGDFAKDLEKKVKQASGPVSFDVLFDVSFMRKYTNFSTFEELLEAGNYEVNSQEDFEAIPKDELNKHIAQTTKFSSWDDMKSEAGTIYMSKKLGF